MTFAAQGQRPLSLLILLVAMILPMALKLFLVSETETSFNSSSWENQLQSSEDFDGDTIHACQANADDECTRINSDDSQLSAAILLKAFEIQNDRKRNIHATVTALVAIAVPLMTFVYAFVFLRQRPCPGPDAPKSKSMRRKERMLRDLAECHIQLPKIQNADTTTNKTQVDKQRECPICLCNFSEGEVVVAAKYCHCSIPARIHSSRTTNNRTDRIAPVDEDADVRPELYRRYFHEACISQWLSDRKMNPKKLCPCCRQPFFSSNSKRREGAQEGDQ